MKIKNVNVQIWKNLIVSCIYWLDNDNRLHRKDGPAEDWNGLDFYWYNHGAKIDDY